MCNTVILNVREYGTPRELTTLVGGEDKLIWQAFNPFARWPEGKDRRDLDLCLCGIDLKATLTDAGLRWRRGADPMENFIE